jgi:hypothetical protein
VHENLDLRQVLARAVHGCAGRATPRKSGWGRRA